MKTRWDRPLMAVIWTVLSVVMVAFVLGVGEAAGWWDIAGVEADWNTYDAGFADGVATCRG